MKQKKGEVNKMHNTTNLHLDKEQKVGIKIKDSLYGKECLTIGIGRNLNSGDFIADTEVSMFLTLSQAIDLYYALHVEMEKYGVHS